MSADKSLQQDVENSIVEAVKVANAFKEGTLALSNKSGTTSIAVNGNRELDNVELAEEKSVVKNKYQLKTWVHVYPAGYQNRSARKRKAKEKIKPERNTKSYNGLEDDLKFYSDHFDGLIKNRLKSTTNLTIVFYCQNFFMTQIAISTQIEAIKQATEEALKSKESAHKFLVDAGIIKEEKKEPPQPIVAPKN